MDIIRSKDNGRVKMLRNLKSRKIRDKEGLYVVEGVKFVDEAWRLKADILFIAADEAAGSSPAVSSLMSHMAAAGTDCLWCDSRIFEGAVDVINSQGIAAVVRKNVLDFNEALKQTSFAILCDRIQDPGNLGTIIRTADAFGPASVILTEGCVDLFNPKVVRSTAGAAFRVRVAEAGSGSEAVKLMKSKGWYVVSTVVKAKNSFEDMKPSGKICLVIGNEGQGVEPDILNISDMLLTIRMTGNAESLNASVAAGICIYEIRKKLL